MELTCDYFRRTRELKETFWGKEETGVPLTKGVALMASEKIFRSTCAWSFMRCQHPSP